MEADDWKDLMAEGEFSILSEILLGHAPLHEVARVIKVTDFVDDRHQCIYQNMLDLHRRGETVDRVTLANELMKNGALESIGGLSYLVQMSPDMPQAGPTEEDLLEGMKDAADAMRDRDVRERIVLASQRLIDRCLAVETPIATTADNKLREISIVDGLLAIANSLNAVARAIRDSDRS